MEKSRFDRWIRTLSTSASRRQTLLALTLGGLMLASDLASGEAKSTRNKHRRKKRPKIAPLTCADQCPETSEGCYNRPFGPPLCGESMKPAGCVHCSSDQDCLESALPYCITGITERESNETVPVFVCPNYPVGVCGSIDD